MQQKINHLKCTFSTFSTWDSAGIQYIYSVICVTNTSIQLQNIFMTPKENSIYIKVKVKSLSRVRLFATPWTVAYQAPPSMGFFRQEYWSGFPFPSPGDLPNPGVEPRFPALEANALTSEPPGKSFQYILNDGYYYHYMRLNHSMAPKITFLLIYSKNLLFQNPPFSPVSRYLPLYWNIFVSIYICYNTLYTLKTNFVGSISLLCYQSFLHASFYRKLLERFVYTLDP